MKFYKLNQDDCCTYLILNTKNNSCVLIDPKLDYEDFYLNFIKNKNGILKAVIDTHTHSEHLSCCYSLKEKTNCNFFMNENTSCNSITKKIKNHEILNIDGIILKCIHTPGHSIDSMCIIFEDKILTGDTLFLSDGAGRDDLPTGNPLDHYHSLIRLSKLPSHLIVYPAHNYTDSSPYTLHHLKKINKYLKIKNKKEFLNLTEQAYPPPDWMLKVISLNTLCNININSIKIPFEEGICQSSYIKSPRSMPISLTKEEFNKIIKSSKDNIFILDVREPEEIIYGNKLEESINIPLKELPKRINELEKYRNNIIISVCSSGNRAIVASRILIDNGFRNIYVLSEPI